MSWLNIVNLSPFAAYFSLNSSPVQTPIRAFDASYNYAPFSRQIKIADKPSGDPPTWGDVFNQMTVQFKTSPTQTVATTNYSNLHNPAWVVLGSDLGICLFVDRLVFVQQGRAHGSSVLPDGAR